MAPFGRKTIEDKEIELSKKHDAGTISVSRYNRKKSKLHKKKRKQNK